MDKQGTARKNVGYIHTMSSGLYHQAEQFRQPPFKRKFGKEKKIRKEVKTASCLPLTDRSCLHNIIADPGECGDNHKLAVTA